MPQEELENVAGERDICNTLLSLLPQQLILVNPTQWNFKAGSGILWCQRVEIYTHWPYTIGK